MLAPIAAKGENVDALTAWLKEIHKKREAAERKRLFYVAATRAREELHLFAAPDLLSNGNLNPRWDALLKSAWPAAQPHFSTAIAEQAPPPGAPFITSLAMSGPGAPELGAPGLVSETWVRAANDHALPPIPLEPVTFEFAAAAEASGDAKDGPAPHSPHRPTLHRLPLTFDPAARFTAARAHKLPYTEPSPEWSFRPEEAHFASTLEMPATSFADPAAARPEASFAARSLGNAVHTFLELLAARIAAGATPAALLAELPAWAPRIAAILRADGLAPATVDRLTRDTRAALENTLRDPDGQWLLTPHPASATELALTASGNIGDASLASIRIDRTFRAGPTPRSPAASPEQDLLWIIDYKTTAHGPSGLEQFLEAQRATYAPQLERYASILARAQSIPPERVRLALYYPAIPRLICWTPPTPDTPN
jgi:ATP-dependent exoDNAse (exonuclease V) beta subunit